MVLNGLGKSMRFWLERPVNLQQKRGESKAHAITTLVEGRTVFATALVLFAAACFVYFILAIVVCTAGHSRQQQNVKGKKQEEYLHGSKDMFCMR